MAFKKIVETPSGATAEYWNIFSCEWTIVQGFVTIRFAGYVNEASRRAGKQPLAIADPLTLAGADFPGTKDGMSYKSIYEKAKALPAFDGAQDV